MIVGFSELRTMSSRQCAACLCGEADFLVWCMVGQTFLSAIESVSGGTFLSLPNGFEAARVARMPPLAVSMTDKNVCPTRLKNATTPRLDGRQECLPRHHSALLYRSFMTLRSLLAVIFLALACPSAHGDPTPASFQSTIHPILEQYCFNCHAREKEKG